MDKWASKIEKLNYVVTTVQTTDPTISVKISSNVSEIDMVNKINEIIDVVNELIDEVEEI